jgi:N-acetylglutamate synthase-like GNAT family acetyltransferase
VRTLLTKHIQAAQATLFRSIAGGSFELMPDWARGFSGLPHPIFNIFWPFNPDGLTDDILADTAAFFSSRNALYAVEIIHDAIPHGPDFLNRRRYIALPPQPAMLCDTLPTQITPHATVSVEPVTTLPGLTAFCSLQNQIFDFDLQDMRRRFPVAQLKEPRITHHLAFVDETPVGCGTMVVTNGVASVWNVGTLDDYRRQGVGSLLVQQMLAEAARRNCDTALLFSTAQAFNFFNQQGFEIFTQRQWFLPQNIEYEAES